LRRASPGGENTGERESRKGVRRLALAPVLRGKGREKEAGPRPRGGGATRWEGGARCVSVKRGGEGGGRAANRGTPAVEAGGGWDRGGMGR
jgi:hypothetical protein